MTVARPPALDARKLALLDALLSREGVAVDAPEPIARRATPERAPLSFAQQRLWFLARLDPASAAYNVPLAIPFRGALHVAALQQTLNEIVQRHEVLRTCFELEAGQPVQRIVPMSPIELPVIALAGQPGLSAREAARRLAAQEAARAFDLERAPLLRARLLRLAPDDHLLLLTLHHIVTDAWSMDILAREMTSLYAAFAAGRRAALPPLDIQYADFAAWQRATLQGTRLQALLDYWRARLDGAAVLALPTDRPRPPVATSHGAAHRFTLDAALAERLRALAQTEQVTLFMLLLAVFKGLLHRYSGQDDIVVGTPIAGRVRPQLEPLIGFFVNSLVLRTSLAGKPAFRELLQRVRETALGAFAHQELPFEKLVEELQPSRDLSRNPLFQVIFQVLRSDGEVDGSHDADGGVPPAGEIAAKFDLSFTLQDRPSAIEAFVEYNTDLYDADTVTQLCAHYVNLARALVAAPEQCIGDAAMLSADEEQHLRVHSNATEADFGPPTCLHTLVERAAAAHPDAIAVEDEYGRTMSYAALDASANRLAQRLRGLGAAPQRIVGIHLERTPDMVVAILAALKAGAAYLPLDPDYPAQRLAYMLDDADAAVLVTRATLAPLPASGATAVLDIDRERDALARMSDAPVATAVQPEHLAYVIYTSGSTGRPKGVMVPHRAIVNHMHWMLSRFAFGAHDAVLQKTPIGFDASVWEVFAPLMAGARLVLARQGAHRDAAHLVQAVARHRISVLQFVPSQLRLVLDEPGLAQCDALRLLFCGGEPLPAELCVRWRERHAAELHNLYGPTEAAIDATSAPCSAIGRDDAVPIGTPIANVQAHVLDRYGNLVPRGVVGVLYLGGAGLACGYLGLPELTADRFVPDPFADRPGARLYDTGDRVRRRRDGALEFVGRIDEQLKLRGYRIEPAELARALESHPQVRQAVAVVRHGADGEPRLAAYAVTAVTTEEAVATSALRAHLRTLLPDYMMPAWITLLPELPRTPHGKIDWQALPEPQADAPAAHSVPAAPAPALEQRVAALWAEVLVRADVGIDDNFFDLGGYSLLMVQIQHRLRAALDAEVALLDLFRYPTVRLLCARLKQRTQDTPAALPRAPASAEPAARRPSMQSRPLFRRPAP